MARKIKLSDIGGQYAEQIDQAFTHNDSLSEDEAQIKLMNWAGRVKFGEEWLADYIHHSPNGGKREKKVNYKTGMTYCPQGDKLRRMGTKAGYPDLIIDIARQGYHGLRIELKKAKGGHVETVQKEWIARLTKQGYKAVVAKGFEQAKQILIEYMSIGRNAKHDLECDITTSKKN